MSQLGTPKFWLNHTTLQCAVHTIACATRKTDRLCSQGFNSPARDQPQTQMLMSNDWGCTICRSCTLTHDFCLALILAFLARYKNFLNLVLGGWVPERPRSSVDVCNEKQHWEPHLRSCEGNKQKWEPNEIPLQKTGSTSYNNCKPNFTSAAWQYAVLRLRVLVSLR